MCKYLLLFFLLLSFEAAGQNIRPANPFEGQNVEARVLFSCPNYPAENIQGLNSLVEINNQNVISLYVVHVSTGVCPGVRPPPIQGYFSLGELPEGSYTTEVYWVDSSQSLPVQNVPPDDVFQFEVRGAPTAVNAWSYLASLLMIFGILWLARMGQRLRVNKIR